MVITKQKPLIVIHTKMKNPNTMLKITNHKRTNVEGEKKAYKNNLQTINNIAIGTY